MASASTSSTKKSRLTAKQWAEAETLWAAGNITYEGLTKRYGLHRSSFERHFRSKKVIKGSTSAAQSRAVAAKVAEASIGEATVIAARIKETKEEHYKMAAGLAKLTWAEILKANQSGSPVAVALNNLKALDSAMNVLKKAREERWAVLGLDRPDAVDPDELPELIVSELTSEQIKELRDRDLTELDSAEPSQAGDSDAQSNEDDTDAENDNGVVEEGED
ncbi:hypothetical protein QN372_00425 [Undibacterium sp. RTI2.1]|uniref:hypothetical protein n=1 Tax=unclassified Undibacterium TaxID=2630295 RepID=UPI002AB47D68|nr:MULTISPECIES: hypothetical protein [unclassified Undibacterium]MDY7537603.1 hypothetical protein [Undibacterium sp. 5I1]MEB0029204.1 hypothetical protein [Undibacterium sp. RTI2.1]MEB0115512.1 hypothetical protein [Undibacterium sp. RTI2.2]MEB0230148.1 hypothetical protein [Undibacterium sp. 10I3]MEB0256340.1 hypothetical protein [Undibacterium sp. 5I1]